METQKIELRRERDFGQVFNAAFAFLKQEFKPFCLALLVFVIPFVLLLSIGITFFYSSTFGLMTNVQMVSNLNSIVKLYELIGVILLLALFAQFVLILTVISYLKIYSKNLESPTLNEIFIEILKNFLPGLGAIILGSIVIAIGTIFCFLPGIYLAVSLSLFLIALIIEKDGIGSAFSRSFQLTHMQWWWTFLIILVSIIMFYALYMILEIPAYVIGFNSVFHNIQQFSSTVNPFGPTYMIYQSVVVTISQLLYAIPLLILAFHYFSLVEIRERPSLIQKIEELGVNE